MKVDLKYVEDSGMGPGWKIPGHAITDDEMGSVMNGILVAHDLVEHVNGWRKIGTVEDEMEACGGIWFTRGQYSDISRNGMGSMHSPEANVAHEIPQNLMYITHRRLKPLNTKPCDVDDALFEIVSQGLELVQSEILDDADHLSREEVANVRHNARHVIHYMRQGYRKAVKKYGNGQTANRLFWNIQDAIENYRFAEEWMEYELNYCIRTGEVYIREKVYNEYYDRFE